MRPKRKIFSTAIPVTLGLWAGCLAVFIVSIKTINNQISPPIPAKPKKAAEIINVSELKDGRYKYTVEINWPDADLATYETHIANRPENLNVSDVNAGDKGDIIVSGDGLYWTVDDEYTVGSSVENISTTTENDIIADNRYIIVHNRLENYNGEQDIMMFWDASTNTIRFADNAFSTVIYIDDTESVYYPNDTLLNMIDNDMLHKRGGLTSEQ